LAEGVLPSLLNLSKFEVRPMNTVTGNTQPETTLLDLDAPPGETSPQLDDYLASAMEELQAMTERVNRGEAIDRDSRDWLLNQVDFIVEIIGNESLELSDDMRSNLLQLLLAIANLNEQIRHQASLAL
jgi:hypothetical protein